MRGDIKNGWVKLALMWVVSVCVLALACFTVLLPIHLAVKKKSVEVTQMLSELKRVRQYVSDENFNRLNDEGVFLADSLEGFVAGSSMAGECTYVIGDIAGKVGVGDFTTKQKTAKALSEIANCKLIQRAYVEVSCKGTYMKFLQLVNEYERSRPVVVIDDFRITVAGDGQNEIKMSVLILVDKQSDAI
jgi:hypothetical protein